MPYREATMGDLQMMFHDGIVHLSVRNQLLNDPNVYAHERGFELTAEQVEKVLRVDKGAYKMATDVVDRLYQHDATIAAQLGVVICGATRIVRWQKHLTEVAKPCNSAEEQ